MKRKNKALMHSDKKLRAIFDSVVDGITVTDMSGKIVQVNDSVLRMHGYNRREEIIGKNAFTLTVKSQRNRIPQYMKLAIEKGFLKNIEYRGLKKDGTEFHSETNIAVIKSASGKPVGFVVTIKDITERKEAEKELKKSKERLDLSLEASQIGIWDLNLIEDTSIRNLRHDQIFGYTKAIPESEWGKKIFFKHIIPEDRLSVKAAFKKAAKTGKLYFECRVLWPDKSVRWITVKGKLLRDNSGKPQKMLGTVIDITELKEAEKEFQKQQNMLESSQTKLKIFSHKLLTSKEEEKKKLASALHYEAGTIAVDFNAKLADMEESIKNKDFKQTEKTLIKCKSMIKETITNLKNIAADLSPPGLEVLGIGDILKDYFSTLEHKRNIKIDFENGLKDRRIDETASITLYRIIQEALNNIGKHSNADRIQIKLFIEEKSNIIKLDISDNGRGFNVEEISQNYLRNHMGIRIMREMAQLLNGDFNIRSAINKGTKISVALPFSKL